MYGSRGRSFPGGGRLIIAAIMIVVALVGYFGSSQVNPVTGQTQHISISPEQETAMGLQAAPEMEAQYGGLSSNQQASELVARVGNQIWQNSDAAKGPYQFEYHLLADQQTINAFALPGGQVFITEALMSLLQTEGQLAGVLAHETSHAILRHSAEQLAKSQLTQGLTGAAVIAAVDPNDPRSYRNAQFAMLVNQMVNLKFSRTDEVEADTFGVKYMAQAGYDPRSMIDVMKVLEQSSTGPRPAEFMSTHPDPGNRIQNIQQAIDQLYPNGVPAGLKR
ncbi:MAG: M48 family metalloprotease [Nitrososphaerales archaeon]